MPVVFLALALLLAAEPAVTETSTPPAPEAAPETAPESPPIPVGAPKDDYGLVAWCYGALGGYLDLYDRVMPEVTRIESTWRKPGVRLEDDLRVYSDLRRESRVNLKLFARAIAAAEKASPSPISKRGVEAVNKGRGAWSAAATLSDARVAQEWMGWALPAVCTPTAQRLETSAKLMGATFDASQAAPEPEPAPASPEAPTEPTGSDAIGQQLMEQVMAPPAPEASASTPPQSN